MADINIFCQHNKKCNMTLFINKQKVKCDYPAPELCSNYNIKTRCCCNLAAKCSYRHIRFKYIKNKIKHIMNFILSKLKSTNIILPNISNITSDIPEIFVYKRKEK